MRDQAVCAKFIGSSSGIADMNVRFALSGAASGRWGYTRRWESPHPIGNVPRIPLSLIVVGSNNAFRFSCVGNHGRHRLVLLIFQ
jgi:hypothetical protein